MRAVNTGVTYDRIDEHPSWTPGRWIGKCKKCGATHQVEGRLASARAPEQKITMGPLAGRTRGARHDYVVRATDGTLYTMDLNGSDMTRLPVRCGDHWCRLLRVFEGTKKSKHECGARCRNATGPSCDCKCRGKHHGSNC